MRIPHSALFVHHELDEATLGQVTRLAGQKGWTVGTNITGTSQHTEWLALILLVSCLLSSLMLPTMDQNDGNTFSPTLCVGKTHDVKLRINELGPNDIMCTNAARNPKCFSLQTTFSPHTPSKHLISISVQALTPKLHPCPLLALISSLVTLTTPTH